MTVGEKIQKYRKELAMSQEELGQKLLLSRQTVSLWEHDQTELIKNNQKYHNTLVGFAMDHGCHEIDGGSGSHGLDMPEDINIVHFYKAYPKYNSLEKGEKNNDDRQKYIYAS